MKDDIFRFIEGKSEPYDYKQLNDELVKCCLTNWKKSAVYILNSIKNKENNKQENQTKQNDDYLAYYNRPFR